MGEEGRKNPNQSFLVMTFSWCDPNRTKNRSSQQCDIQQPQQGLSSIYAVTQTEDPITKRWRFLANIRKKYNCMTEIGAFGPKFGKTMKTLSTHLSVYWNVLLSSYNLERYWANAINIFKAFIHYPFLFSSLTVWLHECVLSQISPHSHLFCALILKRSFSRRFLIYAFIGSNSLVRSFPKFLIKRDFWFLGSCCKLYLH